MSEPNVEQPVEDVLEQQQDAEDEPTRDAPAGESPDEANEADYADQQIEVPVEDDRYPGGPA
jgi:hypothetical protein